MRPADQSRLYIFCPCSDGSADYSLFTINQSDGIIQTRTILQREQKQNYSIEVVVSDKGKPPRQTSFR